MKIPPVTVIPDSHNVQDSLRRGSINSAIPCFHTRYCSHSQNADCRTLSVCQFQSVWRKHCLNPVTLTERTRAVNCCSRVYSKLAQTVSSWKPPDELSCWHELHFVEIVANALLCLQNLFFVISLMVEQSNVTFPLWSHSLLHWWMFLVRFLSLNCICFTFWLGPFEFELEVQTTHEVSLLDGASKLHDMNNVNVGSA